MAEKLKMISLKEQLRRDRLRMKAKQKSRKGKKPVLPFITAGNKDYGVPYRGKDKFSGQFKKYADRIIPNYETEGITRLFVYDNNKYTGSGELRD